MHLHFILSHEQYVPLPRPVVPQTLRPALTASTFYGGTVPLLPASEVE